MNILETQFAIRTQINNLRALDRVIDSEEFAACLKLKPNDKMIIQYVNTVNVEAVRQWIRLVLEEELGDLSFKQLRLLASQYKIKAYSCLTKDELLVSIVQEKLRVVKQIEDTSSPMSPERNGNQAVHSGS